MKVLVCGGRDYSDGATVWAVLRSLVAERNLSIIIHGGARGADWIAADWARKHDVAAVAYPANWKMWGRAAEAIRNQEMLDRERPDLVVAFPGGRGTADMVDRARASGVEVIKVDA